MKNYCRSDKKYGQNYSNDEHKCYKMVHDKKTGEEKLIVKETISIKEKLKEQSEIIDAYKEILKAEVEGKKAENLQDIQNDEKFMKELEIASNSLQDENVYSMMDKMQVIGKIFNNLPKEQREELKTPMNFATKKLKSFLADYKTSKEEALKQTNKLTNEDLQKQIAELESKLAKETGGTSEGK